MFQCPARWFVTLLFGPGMKVTTLAYSPKFEQAVHMAEVYIQGRSNELFTPLSKWPSRTAWKSNGSAVYVVMDDITRTAGFPCLQMSEALKLVERPCYELIELSAALETPSYRLTTTGTPLSIEVV
jgi:hypothetical protein